METKSKTILGICIAVVVVAVVAVVLVLTLNKTEPVKQVTFTSENAEASISQAFLNGESVDGKMESMVFSTDSSKNTATTEKLNTWSDIDLTFNENLDDITLAFNIFNQNTDKELKVKLTYENASESADYTFSISAGIDATSPSAVTSGDTVTLNPNSAGNGKMVTITIIFSAKDGVESVTVDNFELKIELQSEASESINTGGNGNEGTDPLYVVIDNNSNNVVDAGDSIEFGYYPSTIKASNVTISGSADANGYYTGSDGEKYAMVVSENQWPLEFSDGTIQTQGETYYFKVEPIVWTILDVDTNGVAYLFSTYSIDVQQGSSVFTFAESGLSEWLNGEFYNTAFTSAQQDIIQDTTIDEFVDPVKVTLIGSDIANANYGFNTNISSFTEAHDSQRTKTATDYTIVQFRNTINEGSYFIRTINATAGSNTVTSVESRNGTFLLASYGSVMGIAPVVNIQLDSTTISTE